jgi:phosphoribosylaminoimidazole (AIR) synthetase
MSKDISEPNEKTPVGASSNSLTLNNANYSTVQDTLKDYALKLVANAHSEMSEQQWSEWLEEHTAIYTKAITHLITEARESELKRLQKYGDGGGNWRRIIEIRLAQLEAKKDKT